MQFITLFIKRGKRCDSNMIQQEYYSECGKSERDITCSSKCVQWNKHLPNVFIVLSIELAGPLIKDV